MFKNENNIDCVKFHENHLHPISTSYYFRHQKDLAFWILNFHVFLDIYISYKQKFRLIRLKFAWFAEIRNSVSFVEFGFFDSIRFVRFLNCFPLDSIILSNFSFWPLVLTTKNTINSESECQDLSNYNSIVWFDFYIKCTNLSMK